MSRPDDWQFIIEHLVKVSKEKKTAIYAAIKELIEAGYCIREQAQDKKGRWKGLDYIVFETLDDAIEFKKSLPHSGFPLADYPLADNQPLLSIDPNRSIENKDNVPSAIALELANLLLRSIRKTKEDFKDPHIHIWSKHIERMIRLDNRDPKKIKEIIEWLPTNWWKRNILSAEKLRDHFDRLEIEMKDGGNSFGDNEKLANAIVLRFKEQVQKNELQLQPLGLLFSYGHINEFYQFSDSNFRDKILAHLKKMNLPMMDL